MYAVVKSGGKQYRVEPGVELLVEKLSGVEAGQAIELDEVLLYSDGEAVNIGQPTVPVKVHCLCVRHERGPKLRAVKYKRRKNYRRTLGHRQDYTRLLIERFEKR